MASECRFCAYGVDYIYVVEYMLWTHVHMVWVTWIMVWVYGVGYTL